VLPHHLTKWSEVKQLGNFIAVNIDHDNRKAGRLRKILRDFINEF